MTGLVLLSCVFFLTTIQALSLRRNRLPPPPATLPPTTLPPTTMLLSTTTLPPATTTMLLSTTTMPPRCFRDGKYYLPGEYYSPSPCEWCQCVEGQEACMVGYCLRPQCVDAIKYPGQCCSVCPNGRNCYAGDKVIPADMDVQVDEYSTCRCPEEFSFDTTANEAVCTSAATTQV